MNIAVIGGNTCSPRHYKIAYQLGKLIAQEGWILICGGRSGVMEAACKGAKENSGLTVGILPGYDTGDANPYLDVKLPTGLGYARNVLVVRAADVLVAIDGHYGTLSEIAFAFNEEKVVFGIETWKIKGVVAVSSARSAIAKIKKYLKENGPPQQGRA